ncbi:hypothetical protein R3P38DRAFT_2800584 [Favolaschia claudopus]|uniref:Uncharacterized protein n=1 Tax=Favolaschia claudopus TaxID=2862362 RepID=A0AAV9ZY16_9AGAR
MASPPAPNPAGAMLFIRDLYYNPTLRDSYFSALNAPAPARQQKVAALLSQAPYKCTITDIGPGWATLAKQSFLAWQSVYTLAPTGNTTGSTDTTEHTVTVVGSRTGQISVLFDSIPVIGFTSVVATSSNPSVQPTITWTASTSNGGGNKNVTLVFTNIAPGSNTDPTTGDRRIYALIFNPSDPAPPAGSTNYTHSGLDFFADMANFNGMYNTITTDPNSGDEDDNYPATVAVTTDATGGNATAALSVQDPSGNLIAGTGLTTSNNQIKWTTSNNSSTAWSAATSKVQDCDSQPPILVWQQGYLTFGWTYTPPKTTTTTPTPATLQANFNGSIWVSDINQLLQVEGDIQKDSIPPDVVNKTAIIVGAAVSGTIFLVVGVGIAFGIKKLVKWWNDRQAAGAAPNEVELVEINADDQALVQDNGIVSGPHNINAPDPQVFGTNPVQLNRVGQTVLDNNNNVVRQYIISAIHPGFFQNIRDPSGSTALAQGQAEDGTEIVVISAATESGRESCHASGYAGQKFWKCILR